jgi:hypothetical protein
MTIIATLEQIVEELERRGHTVRASLQPGATHTSIADVFEPLGLTPAPDLVTLYQWHNGMDRAHASAPLFGEHYFFPLHTAVRAYHRIVGYYADPEALIDLTHCFPIAGYSGDYYAVYCDASPYSGLLHPIIQVFQGISISFENLSTMAQTALAWATSGVYEPDSANEARISAIQRQYNPRIPYRTTTL